MNATATVAYTKAVTVAPFLTGRTDGLNVAEYSDVLSDLVGMVIRDWNEGTEDDVRQVEDALQLAWEVGCVMVEDEWDALAAGTDWPDAAEFDEWANRPENFIGAFADSAPVADRVVETFDTMIARYAGKCAACGRRFPAGTEIVYDRSAREAKCANRTDCIVRSIDAEIAESQRPATAKAPVIETSAPVQPSKGYYTVTLDDGSHVTIRLRPHWLEDRAEAGVMVAGYLAGADNTGDYVAFAEVGNGIAKVWRKYSTGYERQALALRILTGNADALKAAGAAYATESGNCYRCNRLLTTPDSIAAGIGPECAKKTTY